MECGDCEMHKPHKPPSVCTQLCVLRAADFLEQNWRKQLLVLPKQLFFHSVPFILLVCNRPSYCIVTNRVAKRPSYSTTSPWLNICSPALVYFWLWFAILHIWFQHVMWLAWVRWSLTRGQQGVREVPAGRCAVHAFISTLCLNGWVLTEGCVFT